MSNEWAAHTSLSDMLVTKYPDSCSALLRQFTAYGLPLTSVVISVQANINNSVRELKRLTLGSPIITSISTTGTTETIKLSFPSVKTRWYDGIEESHSKN
jgi:type VI protein secretion system component Hcp